MEKRTRMVRVRLSDNEFNKLKKDSKKAGLDYSKYMRKLIQNEEILAAPTIEYYEFINQLNAIGNNLNQLTKKANQGNFDSLKIDSLLDKLKELLVKIEKEILG